MNHPTNSWHTQTVQQVLKHWRTDPVSGLSEAEANQRQKQYGFNELIEHGRKKPIVIFLQQFGSTLVIILMIAALISGFLGKPTETAAILAIVFLFAFLSFIQEYRAEKALEALKKLSIPLVRVQREGQLNEISARELVPGDIVHLEAGNLIPADLRLIEAVNLQVQESILTGESESVEKDIDALQALNLPLGDRKNLGFMGTQVTYGHGKGVVVATGMQTELGKIATLIQQVESVTTPLQRRLNQVGKLMAVLGISVAVVVMIIGLLSGGTISDMFLTAVSVAVAVVPEGLPAVVTVTLALGAQRMLRRRALIRRLPAVETLGSVTVICSDKTGTLTENRMRVEVIDVAGHSIALGEVINNADMGLPSADESSICREKLFNGKPKSVCMVLLGGALCNDATLRPDPQTGHVQFIGDPTEGALLVAASKVDINQTKLLKLMPRIAELPFDSIRKRMTTVHRIPDDDAELPDPIRFVRSNGLPMLSITKGAFDSLLDICSKVWVDDQEVPLNDYWRERVHQANQKMAEQGMRVLGFATKWLDQLPEKREMARLEQDLTFIGLIGMVDPPRPEVKNAVQTCREAGIRPIMITGDHPLTARFIANELGISNNGHVVTGQELNSMTDEQLTNVINETAIFARVSPEHKLRIVRALQRQGHIVAMTGDGVNDSPALKQADIGVAMGICGTDVTKQASDMILLDDNFATIVAAVEEGRVIYDNIRRFVKFSIAGNLGKVLVMLFMPLLGVAVALLPLQLLWLNLLTDGLLGLGLGLEPAESNTMKRPPRKPKAHFFSEGLGFHVIWVGMLIGLITLAVGYIYYDPLHPEDNTWQTMIFTVLAFLQTGQALGSRSMNKDKILSLDVRSNPTMWLMIVAVVGLQLAAIYLPALNLFFNVKPLAPVDLAICIGLTLAVYVPVKIEKYLRRNKAI